MTFTEFLKEDKSLLESKSKESTLRRLLESFIIGDFGWEKDLSDALKFIADDMLNPNIEDKVDAKKTRIALLKAAGIIDTIVPSEEKIKELKDKYS